MSVPHRKFIYGRFLIFPAILAVFSAAMPAAVQLSTEYGTESLGAAAGVFAAVLMMLLLGGVCMNHCFPIHRKQDFNVLMRVCSIVVFGVVMVIGLELRMNYIHLHNMPVDHYGVYEAAGILRSGVRPGAGTALFYLFCRDPAYYAYTAFQSVLISLFGYRGEVHVYANLVLQLTGAFCAAGTAYVFGGRAAGLFVCALLLCMPQEAAFLVRMEAAPLYFAILMISLFLLAVTMETEKNDRFAAVHFILYFMDGLLFGIACFIHPVTLAVIAAVFFFLCFMREREECRPVISGALRGCACLAGACMTFFPMLFLKAEDLKSTFSVVAFPYLECFIPNGFGSFSSRYREAWSAHLYPSLPDGYTTVLENEITIVILLCLCFITLVFAAAWKRRGAVCVSALLIGLAWLCGCGRIRVESHLLFLTVLFLTGFLPQEFYWLFCESKDEECSAKETQAEGSRDLSPADLQGGSETKPEAFGAALPETDQPEEMQDTETSADGGNDVKKEIHYIENPLPVPKKHVPKTLDFDHDVSDDDDFDI